MSDLKDICHWQGWAHLLAKRLWRFHWCICPWPRLQKQNILHPTSSHLRTEVLAAQLPALLLRYDLNDFRRILSVVASCVCAMWRQNNHLAVITSCSEIMALKPYDPHPRLPCARQNSATSVVLLLHPLRLKSANEIISASWGFFLFFFWSPRKKNKTYGTGGRRGEAAPLKVGLPRAQVT